MYNQHDKTRSTLPFVKSMELCMHTVSMCEMFQGRKALVLLLFYENSKNDGYKKFSIKNCICFIAYFQGYRCIID